MLRLRARQSHFVTAVALGKIRIVAKQHHQLLLYANIDLPCSQTLCKRLEAQNTVTDCMTLAVYNAVS